MGTWERRRKVDVLSHHLVLPLHEISNDSQSWLHLGEFFFKYQCQILSPKDDDLFSLEWNLSIRFLKLPRRF